MEELYTAVRFYKSGKNRTPMKYNMTIEKVIEFVSQYPTTKNSFVGFVKQ